MAVPPRLATLVLCTPSGDVLGRLPAFEAPEPWWQDAAGLVRETRRRYDVEVTVLRLLDAALPSPPGGPVTYLAQLDSGAPEQLPLSRWSGTLELQSRRLPYAEPDGPRHDLEWAGRALAAHGLESTGRPEQMRSWNLSSLWRIPVGAEWIWLKCVPPFFAHEGTILAALQGAAVPRLLAADGGRVLLAEVPGTDQYGADLPVLLALVTMLVGLQAQWIGRESALLDLGLPDWRPAALSAAIESVVRRNGAALSASDRRCLDDFVAGLDARFTAVSDCGIPNSLVHGDFAPGNARGEPDSLVLLDWGDCGVGHPLLDRAAFLDRIAADQIPSVVRHWDDAWRRAVPGSDPGRAAAQLAPVAAARQAVIYQGFLDQIEPSEHPYHRGDPADWLTRTAALLTDQAA